MGVWGETFLPKRVSPDYFFESQSVLCACFSRCANLIYIQLDKRTHLRGLPFGILGLFGPSKGKAVDFSRLSGLFQYRQRFKENCPLPLSVADLAHGPSIGIFDCSGAWDAYESVKFRRGGEHYGREACFLQKPRSQSDGLATKGSSW